MPTVQETISIAQLSLPMARVDVDKSSFRGGILDYLLPWKILVLKKSVQWASAQSATYSNIEATANFLYALCDKYGVLASDALNIQTSVDGGPVVTVVDEVSVFPIAINETDFTSATFYPDTRLVGNEIKVHLNEINRFLTTSEFSVSGTGLTILLDGFDASLNTYDITIWKING